MKRKFLVLFAVVLIVGLVFASGPEVVSGAPPIVLGVPNALRHTTGFGTWKAAELAADEINAKGGVLVGGVKRPIKIVTIETREDEPGIPLHEALMAHEKLILQQKPDAIAASGFRSEVILAAMDLYAKYKLVHMSTISMSPVIPKKFLEDPVKYKYTFKTNSDSIYSAKVVQGSLELIRKAYGFNKVYFILQDTLWARGLGDALKKGIEPLGWKVIAEDFYPVGAAEFSPSLTKAKEAGAQVIVPIFDMVEAVALPKQIRTMKVPAIMCGLIAPLSPSAAWKAFGEDIEYSVQNLWIGGLIPVKAIPESVKFWENLGKKFGEEARGKMCVDNGTTSGYVAVYALAAAITRAGTLDSDALVAAMEKTDLMSPMGRIRFGKDHAVIFGFENPKETAIGCAFQWVKGRQEPVFPELIAKEKILLPPWMK